jgi:peptide chain release factor 1
LKSLVTNSREEKDMREMAAEELLEAVEEEKQLQHELFRALLPKDEADERDCILEVRAGKLEFVLCIHEHNSSFQFFSVIGR